MVRGGHQKGVVVKIWNVAVIGAGIGRNHIAEGYLALPDKFRVMALCDIDPGRLRAVSEEFGIARATANFGELLVMPEVDIIDICTPPALHLEQSLMALSAGKHLICEKPLVGSLAEADRLIAAEKAAGGRLLPVFQYRFGNGLQKARRIIMSGIAGKPYLATVETAWIRRAAYYAVPWRGKYETELGGTLVTHAIHAHDLLTYLMGPVASVFARIATRVNAVEVEDTAVASLAMQSGALASLSVTLGSAREISRLRLCFEHVTFESSLSPYAPGDDPWLILPASAATADAIDQALADWQFVGSRYAGLFAAYHTALETGGPLPVTLAEARASLELVTALYHSAATGQNVDLPIAPSHPRYRSWRPI
ncbi:MAG: Gfo/Idh/MocA family oxidoreductase [Alphaproteobacteria bacterium]|nr:Gfo/Idh/MocA family oxidoreductase [Alphaproteobacteria bacterium]